MAIKATYNSREVILKIDRIWGSKSENWNAWANVFSDSKKSHILETFSINSPYIEGENPYVALYTALGNLSFLSNVHHDNTGEWILANKVELEKKSKKTKKS